jgi:DNA-binding NarL/FixJ family response regulator
MTVASFTTIKPIHNAEETLMIRILLVDDKPTVRQGVRLRLALEPDLIVVGEASDGLEALALVQALQPDVIIMDVQLPGIDGIAATERLRELAPHSAVVMLSMRDDVDTKTRARQAGAVAFVEKRGAPELLLWAIRNAAG